MFECILMLINQKGELNFRIIDSLIILNMSSLLKVNRLQHMTHTSRTLYRFLRDIPGIDTCGLKIEKRIDKIIIRKGRIHP
jgi:hypothetical protein